MRTVKKEILNKLVAHFIKHTKLLTEREYAATSMPVRPFFIRRNIGSWPRVLKLIEVNFPEEYKLLTTEKKPEIKVPTKKTVEPKEDADE